ncbi:MAG: hypothetical protein VB934_12990, partial [Polyangiaceae bacterium]
AGDPAINITLPALQATFPDPPTANLKQYIGTRVSSTTAESLSALNLHVYFRARTKDGRRVGTYPENPLFGDQYEGAGNIHNMLRWRDENTPQLPLHVTEWGWDSDSEYEDCTFDECVSERAQALYGLRGLLMLARLGVSRATWFFYANSEDSDTLFHRSGLTNSKNSGWAKKMVFRAFKDLLDHVGDAHFVDVLQEDDEAYAYLLGDAQGEATHLVAWRPVDVSDEATAEITLPIADAPGDAFLLAPQAGQTAPAPTFADGQWTVSISGQPLLVYIGDGTSPPDDNTTTTGSGGSGGSGGGGGADSGDDEASGCGCLIIGRSGNSATWLGLLLAAGLMINRRRASSRSRSAS